MTVHQEHNIIHKLLKLTPSENRAFIFDIDSTLYDVSPRNQHVVRHFAQTTSSLQKSIKEKLLKFKALSTEWGILPGLSRLGLTPHEHLIVLEIKAHWNQFFFNGDFLKYDREYPHAVKFLNALNSISPVHYLTGRDIPRLGTATISQLKKSLFPMNSHRNRLILKPNKSQPDRIYKLTEIKNFSAQFEDLYFFENEPVILNTIHKELPKVHLYWINSVHSQREDIYPHITSLVPNYKWEL